MIIWVLCPAGTKGRRILSGKEARLLLAGILFPDKEMPVEFSGEKEPETFFLDSDEEKILFERRWFPA